MDNTLNALRNLQAQQAHNGAYTAIELEVARADGADAVTAAVARGESIILMDEASANTLQNAHAVGWNSEWANIQSKIANEVKSAKDAQSIAIDYANQHDADARFAQEVASKWFQMGEGNERQKDMLLSVLKRRLGVLVD